MKSRGFTLIEMIVVVGISGILMVVLVRFIGTGYPVSRIIFSQSQATESARLQLKRIAKVMREVRQADTGAYPLVEMSPQKIVFYSDVDEDSTVELVRYELVGTELERGLTEPSGDPLTYDPGSNEVSSVIASHIRNGVDDIFTYYTGDYPADQTPLTPVDLTEVKYIEFRLLVDVDPDNDPDAIEIVSQVQLRNLKTNLGESVN